MREGVDGLLRDKTRPSRIPPLSREVTEHVVALTQADEQAEATHWTTDVDGASEWHQRQSGVGASGKRTDCSRTATVGSNIYEPSSSPNCATWSGST